MVVATRALREATAADAASAPAPAADGGRPLRIGMVAPPWFELPPTAYGGIEAVVADLVDQLQARGHEVTLVAAGRNRTTASRFRALYDVAPSGLIGSRFPEVLHAAYTGSVLAELDLDVVHDHSLAGPLLARERTVPTLVTMHGPVDSEYGQYVAQLGSTIDLVAISDAQRRHGVGMPWIGRVHNAIDVTSYPFRAVKDDYVLWIGRFNPEKGPEIAIDAARARGRRIVLAGKLTEDAEKQFFEDQVRPRLGPDAEYVGEADSVLKRELYAGAACLAMPLQWEEPFGIVMVEAMAAGTPVVALRRGSAPEVVRHRVGGLVVDGFDEFCLALDKARDLDPRTCRRRAEEHFDLPVMAAGYEQVYRRVTSADRPVQQPARQRRLTGRRAVAAVS